MLSQPFESSEKQPCFHLCANPFDCKSNANNSLFSNKSRRILSTHKGKLQFFRKFQNQHIGTVSREEGDKKICKVPSQ